MKRKWWISIFLLVTSLLLIITVVYARVDYDLSWWTVDSGGGQTNGSGYSLQGIAGQPDVNILQGGGYTLVGGFLSGIVSQFPPHKNLFLPLVIR